MTRTISASVLSICLLAGNLSAQTTATKPALDPSVQTTLEKLIKSGKPAEIDQAIAILRKQFAENAKATEPVFKALNNNLAILMSQPSHTQDMLSLIASAKRAKAVRNAAGTINNVSYMWAMQVIVFHRANNPAEAKSAFDDGLAKGLGRPMCNDILKFWPLVFKKDEKQDEYLALLQSITMNCWDTDIVELALKKRIEMLNAMSHSAEALVDAKRLFIVSSMPHSAAALVAFERQLAISDPSKASVFHSEQTEGNTAPANFESAADAHKSTVLLDIKLDTTPDKNALAVPGDGTPVDVLLHPALVYLLCDQPEEALNVIKRATLQAIDPVDAASVYAMTARLMKAQDGTLSRANAYIASKPAVPKPAATPKPAAPKPAPSTPDIP